MCACAVIIKAVVWQDMKDESTEYSSLVGKYYCVTSVVAQL